MSVPPRWWSWGDPVGPLREILARGGILAIPTESSYGLAADPRSAEGVELIYRVKARSAAKPLPVVIADRQQLESLGAMLSPPPLAWLAAAWPAPLNLVLPLRHPLPAAGGGSTLAVRIPAHRRLRELLRRLGTGVTATSANRSGETPLVDPRGLEPLLAGLDAAVVNDGILPGGAPSTTVVAVAGGWRILRQGRYPEERLRALLDERETFGTGVSAAEDQP